MPLPSYKDFQPQAEQNTASPPVGAGEGGFLGKYVNDCLRYVMAALRNLGDITAKLGDNMGPDTRIAGMALQDPGNVAITGGSISGVTGGGVPIGSVIPWWGTLADAAALLVDGWAICDGRTVNLPSGGTKVLPDIHGRYLRFYNEIAPPTATGGSFTTDAKGAQAQQNITATVPTVTGDLGVERGYASLGYHNVASGSAFPNMMQGLDRVLPQTVTIPAVAEHAHDVVPPFASFVPLMRIF